MCAQKVKPCAAAKFPALGSLAFSSRNWGPLQLVVFQQTPGMMVDSFGSEPEMWLYHGSDARKQVAATRTENHR